MKKARGAVLFLLPAVALSLWPTALATGKVVLEQAVQSKDPVVRATSNLVLVDLVAWDRKSGARLTGLMADDFQLLDNNKPVTITAFNSSPRPIHLWFVMICNQVQWFDEGSTFFAGKTETLRAALAGLNPLDKVAVAHWCDDGTCLIDLQPTSNREAGLAVIEEVLHRYPSVRPDCAPGTLALQRLIGQIADCTRAAVPRPTPVLVFVHGDAMGMSVGRACMIAEEMHEISAIVYGINNGAFKGVHRPIACTRILDFGEPIQMMLAHFWSEQTGGRVFSPKDEAYGPALKELLAEAHARYQIGFVPERLDGKSHRLKLRMSDGAKQRYSAVAFRHRTQYKADPDRPSKGVAGRQPVDDAQPLTFALTSATPASDVSFEAMAQSLPDRPAAAQVKLAIEPAALTWVMPSNSGDRRTVVTVLIAYLSAGGVTLDYEVKDLEVTRSKKQWEEAQNYPVVFSIDSSPSAEADRIRVIVRDAETGRMGRKDLRRVGSK